MAPAQEDRATASRQTTPALFLDRDGVINVDSGFVHRVDQVEFVPGIFDLVGFAARQLCWPVVVVTNQAGIGRGLFGEAEYQALTRWLQHEFEARAAPIACFYHCPYHPEHGIDRYRRDHPWRKPNPGMLLQAASDLTIDLARSVLIGDRPTDMAAGAAAGVGLLIGFDHERTRSVMTQAHAVVHELTAALPILQAHAEGRHRWLADAEAPPSPALAADSSIEKSRNFSP
ncbi:MAG: HAD family hydrolase [Methylobacteriaceae bacterium]|nr:HAD family hydrolase [Methylobacteriaceae bacterium]